MNKVVIAGEAPASPFLFYHDDVLWASRNAFSVEQHDGKTDGTTETDFDSPSARLYPPQVRSDEK